MCRVILEQDSQRRLVVQKKLVRSFRFGKRNAMGHQGLGLDLPEGYRGEVNLGLEDWTREVARVLDRGFALTIDYGDTARELYSHQNGRDTLVCYHRHDVREDPYQDIGRQDITCHVPSAACQMPRSCTVV